MPAPPGHGCYGKQQARGLVPNFSFISKEQYQFFTPLNFGHPKKKPLKLKPPPVIQVLECNGDAIGPTRMPSALVCLPAQMTVHGKSGFQLFEGVNEAPQRKRAQHKGPFISYYELWHRRHRKFFSVLKMVKKFSTKYMANDDFLNPLDTPIPKIPFSSFADFRFQVTPEAGVSLRRIFGAHQVSPFLGGVLARGLCRHASLEVESPPTPGGASWGAYRALCARCAKSRPFSTTGRQFLGCRIAAGYYCRCVSL